jgi:hypothetical protein
MSTRHSHEQQAQPVMTLRRFCITEQQEPPQGRRAPDERLDVHRAWFMEKLSGGRVHILTQEAQVGKPAQALAKTKPNSMINGHQDWLDGMVGAAKARCA